MARKASVIIEKDEHGFYAWCPELKGCQSQGETLEQAIANIKEAIELYLETLPESERDVLLSREILTTAVEVNGSNCRAGRPPMPNPRCLPQALSGCDQKAVIESTVTERCESQSRFTEMRRSTRKS